MAPPSNFGQDITNTTSNNPSENNGSGNGLPNPERMGGTMLFNKLAGRGVIRVVNRCEDAKENNKLGE